MNQAIISFVKTDGLRSYLYCHYFFLRLTSTLKVNFLFTFLSKDNYNESINLPLSCHLVGSRLGRKNRLNDGFFIFDVLVYKDDNTVNTTVTLSALMGNAQPWRFFYACSGELHA